MKSEIIFVTGLILSLISSWFMLDALLIAKIYFWFYIGVISGTAMFSIGLYEIVLKFKIKKLKDNVT